jgi:esterase
MTVDLAFSELADKTNPGPPLIILHGLFGWKRNWAAIAKTLSEDYRVFTLDMRNHGDSPHAPEMSYETMAADVARFIHTHDLGPVPIVGHSMGGKASMILALSEPGLVERLLVLDIAPIPYDRDYDDYISALRDIDFSNATNRSAIDIQMHERFPDRAVRTFLMQNLTKDANGAYGWRVNLDAIEAHMDDIMGFPDIDSDQAYEGPTLFLGGSESDYITLAHQAEIDRLFPLADLDVISDAGHWVHADQPAAFANRLRGFLRA